MGEAEIPRNAEGRSQSGTPEDQTDVANPWFAGIVTAGSPDEPATAIASQDLRPDAALESGWGGGIGTTGQEARVGTEA